MVKEVVRRIPVGEIEDTVQVLWPRYEYPVHEDPDGGEHTACRLPWGLLLRISGSRITPGEWRTSAHADCQTLITLRLEGIQLR